MSVCVYAQPKSWVGWSYTKMTQFRSAVSPYANTVIFFGWIPFVVYRGLQRGTHKYITQDKPTFTQERNPRYTDVIPIVGSHGLP